MGFIWSLAAFIIAIGVLITVHEFGHYWVARRCGVYVERFSIGFGKTLWRKVDKQGTEFVLAMIPLGGYVKMLDERVGSVSPERRHQAFNNKTVGQRAAIIGAGPIANFLLAIVVYWVVFMIGVPSVKPVIEDVKPGSIAAIANFEPKMELKSIDGIETPDWNSVRLALVGKIGDHELTAQVLPSGYNEPMTKTVDLTTWQFDPEKQDPILSLGIMPVSAKIDPVIQKVTEGLAGERAGLQKGDRIVSVNGEVLGLWNPVTRIIRNNPGVPLKLEVQRSQQLVSLTLTPDSQDGQRGEKIGFAGVELSVLPLADEYKMVQQYGPFSAFYQASDKTWQLMKLTVNMMGKLVVGDVKLNNLSGPISIAKGAGVSAESGLVYYLMFIALISVNLGIINLFPLPVLDGGHLLFLLIEKIKGSPVSERVQDFSFRIGAMALILLMGLALFNDFSRF
ncbi:MULTISPECIES: sigma E protease regulator RseP [Providencia]|uniref:Zinc metalloprotease n=1 Tax=Providencia rettgeri TaxID=587 RepID=A0A379FUQ5_PRORE|nr:MULTISPECIES: sigma E protease regulator RseP [Providencia]EJD6376157.1 sigma E protease regulator RseP [Providencia rettgeri]ELR5115626.1 sigma E protease regulator RseP [Providencia rettgeri]MBI6202070.1 sigma E protease regulator RseP [Providencia rettgeri]MCG5280488.1 sigma E protease regulator RseP [Providencia rettgeri]MCX9109477.1 sigma E protease regulator RseP [Providencia rettgeri]